ncbi:mRNA degradation protein pet127, mitochondrial Flags: Precursor [Serendipita indica DSM 11827]|nr:mRNA degradation protein pet127, mitochondrial Flags: Precursor [Serendipita indica DSM 11827]
MLRTCVASRNALIPAQRAFSTTSTRSASKKKKKKPATVLKPIPIPSLSDPNLANFSEKLRKRLLGLNNDEKANVASKVASLEDTSKDAMDDINRIVTGWGEDKLAPKPDPTTSQSPEGQSRDPPAHNSKVDLGMVRQFEIEAFYRHGRTMPLFERRLQVWLPQPSKEEPTLVMIEPPHEQPPIAQLAHSLDRVLFNPGPHWLREPRSGVYNFDSHLEKLPDIHTFDFDRLEPYTPSSKDETLAALVKREGKQFGGSTSSLTTLLSHIYLLLCHERGIDTSSLSVAFSKKPTGFSQSARWPGGVTFRHYDCIYCIDSHEIDEQEKNLLLNMGTMLEKFVTQTPEQFSQLLRSTPTTEDEGAMKKPETYRYSTASRCLAAAALLIPSVSRARVFDIKTRAAVAIRYDPLNVENNSNYMIKTLHGDLESFEREQYDLFRAAFLKYQFQVRIGGMDGIFVAYHNTSRFFGFQYFNREDMDSRLFGGSTEGDRVFDRCVQCLEEIANEVTMCYPGQSVRCLFESSDEDQSLRIYVEPEEWDETRGDRPITELLITATNFVDGERVVGPMDFSRAQWSTLLNVTRSSSTVPSLVESIRTERDALEKKKNAFSFWLPEDMSAVEMADKWQKLNYRKERESDDDETTQTNGVKSKEWKEEQKRLIEMFSSRRVPSPFVATLRKLASEGKTYLEELEQGGAMQEHSSLAEDILTVPVQEAIQDGYEPSPEPDATPVDQNAVPVVEIERHSSTVRGVASADGISVQDAPIGEAGLAFGTVEDAILVGIIPHIVIARCRSPPSLIQNSAEVGMVVGDDDPITPPEGAEQGISPTRPWESSVPSSEESQRNVLDPTSTKGDSHGPPVSLEPGMMRLNGDGQLEFEDPSSDSAADVDLRTEDQAWSSSPSKQGDVDPKGSDTQAWPKHLPGVEEDEHRRQT